MSSSHAVALPDLVERLSWEEIRAQHPDRWVVLAKIDWEDDTHFKFHDADVLGAFENRKDASPTVKAVLAKYRSAACFWTGEIRCPRPWLTS
jgi:hypothetical protein